MGYASLSAYITGLIRYDLLISVSGKPLNTGGGFNIFWHLYYVGGGAQCSTSFFSRAISPGVRSKRQ